MPKKNDTTEEVQEASVSEALAPKQSAEITTITDLSQLSDITPVEMRPTSLDRNDLSGTEDIDPNEIRLPRLAIAQSLTPQFIEGDPMQIPGLGMFEMFNDVTNERYGRDPITFLILRRDERRIEFRPRNEGGGVIDLDVPPGDPRLDWTPATETTPRMPPRATTFYEFVILLLRKGRAPEPIMLSIKMTNKFFRKQADNLKTFIKLRGAAIYAGLYTVDTKVPAKNDKGTFGVHMIKNAGFVPVGTPVGDALLAYAKEFHERLKGKTVEPKMGREEVTDTDFDPEDLEQQPRQSVNAGM